MKAYIITQEQREALLKELELQNFKNKDGQFFVNQDAFKVSQEFVDLLSDSIHRRFHYIVCTHLDK
jgi:hypothetical protein